MDKNKNKFEELVNSGFIVEDYILQQKFSIGSPGTKVFESEFTFGEFPTVTNNPEQFEIKINYDCPYIFPLRDKHVGDFDFKNRKVRYFHDRKTRGQQEFSTLDLSMLTQFSSIQISLNLLNSDIENFEAGDFKVFKLKEFTWELINHLNEKINDTIEEFKYKKSKELLNNIKSYRIIFVSKKKQNLVAQIIYPYTGVVDIPPPSSEFEINHQILDLYLNEKVALKKFVKDYIPKIQQDESFEAMVFRIVHDFSYYTSERPEAFFNLKEEIVRDLFFVILKILFPFSETEAFNYDGKLDFKIINPKNKYELITGEFKIWNGVNSFQECMHQITEKHSTGAEKTVYTLYINRNKKVEEVYQKILRLLKKEPHYLKEINANISLSVNQNFSKHKLKIKNNEIDLILGIVNVFHEKQ